MAKPHSRPHSAARIARSVLIRAPFLWLLLPAILALLGAAVAQGATVQELVRVKGHERNTLVGLGIVIGLNGTGDRNKDSLVAARPFAQYLKNLDASVGSLDELRRTDSFAVVQVSMSIPPMGAAEGDRFDVTVSSLFNAKSLAGGTLVVSMLRLPLPDASEIPVMAFAQGSVEIPGGNPRDGVVRSGGQMLRSVMGDPIQPDGSVLLILRDEFAGYPVASALTTVINEEMALLGERGVARTDDAKTIRLRVPQRDRADPSNFLARVLTFHVDGSLIRTPARVVVNEREGIIVVTDNVEIRPVAITHAGLQITTITPEPIGTPEFPVATTTRWAGVATNAAPGAPGSTRLADLLRTLDQLDISARDQIAIIYELRRSGALSAEIVSE
ncbi:MAG: flagellar basal body P-ring protein FlgI [Phycisphaeraceae bacterium]|nr:flagellar basal body P-ring protein FlgI [Phycisphaeraceae bacterium]